MTAGPIRNRLHTHGLLYYAWVIPGFLFVVIIGMLYWKFIWHLPVKVRQWVLIVAMLYLGGAIGVELVGEWHHERYGQDNLRYSFIATAEEALEVTGIIVFIHALLDYMSTVVGEVIFSFVRLPKGLTMIRSDEDK